MLDLFLIAQLQAAPQPTPCGEAKPVQVEAPASTRIEVRESTQPAPPPLKITAPVAPSIPSDDQPLPQFRYLRQFVPHWSLNHLR